MALLEGRAKSTASDPKAVGEAAPQAARGRAVGGAPWATSTRWTARLDGVLAHASTSGFAAKKAERAAAAAAAADQKRALVAEAEQLSQSTSWKATGERYRAIVEEWKAIRGVDRKTDSALWGELSKARRQFDARRRAHFAELEQQRGSGRRAEGEAGGRSREARRLDGVGRRRPSGSAT